MFVALGVVVMNIKEKVEELKLKSKSVSNRRVGVISNVAGLALLATAFAGPKIALSVEKNDIEKEQKELLALNEKETQYNTTVYKCSNNLDTKKLLEDNGYSLNLSSETKDGYVFVDIVDKNNESVGIASDFHAGSSDRIVNLIVVNDSSLNDFIQTQSGKNFMKESEGVLSCMQGERFVDAMKRHTRVDYLNKQHKHLSNEVVGMRTREMGGY